MKMKKLVSLLMVAALSASMLTGCGSSNDAAGSSDAATDAATDAAADAAAEGTENAAGGTLKIGGIGPLTGSAAVYGTAVANGKTYTCTKLPEYMQGILNQGGLIASLNKEEK